MPELYAQMVKSQDRRWKATEYSVYAPNIQMVTEDHSSGKEQPLGRNQRPYDEIQLVALAYKMRVDHQFSWGLHKSDLTKRL